MQLSIKNRFRSLVACCVPQQLTIIALCLCLDISAGNSHCPLKELSSTCPFARYKIVDLGISNLKASQLSRLDQFYSLAPAINNFGQIVYNQVEGAYVRDSNVGEYTLSIPGIKVFGHAINNKGEIIVSLQRPQQDVEWMIWSKKSGPNKAPSKDKWHVASFDPNAKGFFCAINDAGTVIGLKQDFKPLVWSSSTGLQALGQSTGLDISASLRSINDVGHIAGTLKDTNDVFPMLWRPSQEVEVLRDYRKQIGRRGWIELADMVVDHDGVVFGNFQLKYVPKDENQTDVGHYLMYRWNPEKEGFSLLDIQDMRITAINRSNTMVGSYKGRAATYHEGQEPVVLQEHLVNPDENWELIEATAINERGQVVGFGNYQGKLHLFLLEPTL